MWRPEYYMVPDRHDRWCVGIAKHGSFILGGNFMANHDVYFDLVNKGVSWVRSECGDKEFGMDGNKAGTKVNAVVKPIDLKEKEK